MFYLYIILLFVCLVNSVPIYSTKANSTTSLITYTANYSHIKNYKAPTLVPFYFVVGASVIFIIILLCYYKYRNNINTKNNHNITQLFYIKYT